MVIPKLRQQVDCHQLFRPLKENSNIVLLQTFVEIETIIALESSSAMTEKSFPEMITPIPRSFLTFGIIQTLPKAWKGEGGCGFCYEALWKL